MRRRRVDVFSVRCLHFDPDGEQGPNLHVAGLLYNDEPKTVGLTEGTVEDQGAGWRTGADEEAPSITGNPPQGV